MKQSEKTKGNIPFQEWMAEIKAIAEKEGYTIGVPDAVLNGLWRDYYDQGLTPQKAWNKG